jgi:hypothetical protein
LIFIEVILQCKALKIKLISSNSCKLIVLTKK